jgi:hypothetical protein
MDVDPFIDKCVSEAKLFGYKGYNLDWEPTDAVTNDDGAGLCFNLDIQVFCMPKGVFR